MNTDDTDTDECSEGSSIASLSDRKQAILRELLAADEPVLNTPALVEQVDWTKPPVLDDLEELEEDGFVGANRSEAFGFWLARPADVRRFFGSDDVARTSSDAFSDNGKGRERDSDPAGPSRWEYADEIAGRITANLLTGGKVAMAVAALIFVGSITASAYGVIPATVEMTSLLAAGYIVGLAGVMATIPWLTSLVLDPISQLA